MDLRREEPVSSGGRIVIAYGRDATDVVLSTQFGPADFLGMQVSVERLDSSAQDESDPPG